MNLPISAWIHPPESVVEQEELLGKLAERGVSSVIVNAKGWSGQAKYPSKIAHHSPDHGKTDVFGKMLEKSHELSMTFEAWFCVFTESMGSNLFKLHPDCKAEDVSGQQSGMNEDGAVWPCPVREEVKQYQLSLLEEVCDLFPEMDGLHLDYIRYPWSNGKVCSCQTCQEQFQQNFGFDLLRDVYAGGGATGKGFDAFVQWRCGHIRELVSRAASLAANKSKRLSAAVFPFYPSILFDLGQDWVEWCQAGLLDTVHVMNYNWSAAMVGRYTAVHSHFMSGESPVLSEGLWIHKSMDRTDIEDLCMAAMNNGACGLTFFVGQTLADFPVDILEFLQKQ